ncbi:MAG: hypothetical protein V4627_15655 [Pseudomonadota bacterium]
MKNIHLIATIFIAICTTPTGAIGQNVYRCGSSYSQNPCPDAVVVDVDDTRSKAQKAEADAKTKRETAQVQTLENTHQKEESRQRTADAQLTAAERKKSPQQPKAHSQMSDSTDHATPKARAKDKKMSSKKSKNEPAVFVASVPATRTKPAARTTNGK